MSINRKIGFELKDGHVVGRDPRQMTQPELLALGHSPMSPQKALRLRCLECCAGSALEVRLCTAMDCPAWPFRMDKNPWRAPPSEAKKQRGRDLVAGRAACAENLRQGRGSGETDEVPATILPANTAEEKNPTESVGKEECA